MILGSHVNFGPEQLLSAAKQAISYNANTFMFYTGAPQNTIRKPIDKELTTKAHELMKENNIDLKNVVCHAPYIVNLANKEKNWDFSINFIKSELKRCDELKIDKMVLHPGNALKMTHEEGIKNITEALNIILKDDANCKILIETMAGKGTECGINLDEINNILTNVENKNRIGVCLDTCHLNDSGVDIKKFDDYLKNFDQVIGIEKIGCIHLNDSKNEIGSKKDRHENIGYGTIGFKNLLDVLNNDKLKDVPKILETPFIDKYAPYKFEIEMLKSKNFNPSLEQDVINYYK